MCSKEAMGRISERLQTERTKTDFIFHQKFFRKALLFSTLSILQITFAQSKSEDGILAQIGEKKISVEEFLQRSELTPRPLNFKGKSVTLNNLITEKLLASEAALDGKLSRSPVLQGKLRGIKEQLMRDRLYEEVAYNKVELDPREVKDVYRASMREYELEFYTIHHKELAQRIGAAIDSVPQLSDETFKEVEQILGKKPLHKVSYKDPDDKVIHEALFTSLLDTGRVVGPLRLGNGEYIMMKVVNWVDYPLISGEDQQIRWKKVQEKLHETKALKLWRSFQTNTMKGKTIEFERNTFNAVSNLAMGYFFKKRQSDSLDSQYPQIPMIPIGGSEVDPGTPFFTIDGAVWTLDDFKKELASHPLVFRTRDLSEGNFREQFKLAIVDMVGDYYLTKEAYRRSLDNSEKINREVEMWKDSFLAIGQERSILKSAAERGIIDEHDNASKLKYLESYLLDLQKRYGSSIWINHEELGRISLTNVDLFAWRPGVPHPVAVPTFPILINSENLGYASRFEPSPTARQ
jgi:hypothetical protein